jgi:hypothetical protein
MRHWHCALGILIVLAGPAPAAAQEIGWQEAVARLATERSYAETCVRFLKQSGDPAAVRRGEFAYDQAKAEVNGVVAGLIVALVKDDEPPSLPDLEARLERGVEGRAAFCEQVEPFIPDAVGERTWLVPVLVATLPPLIVAVKEIYLAATEKDPLTRQPIQTQLEATRWPAFADIPSAD